MALLGKRSLDQRR